MGHFAKLIMTSTRALTRTRFPQAGVLCFSHGLKDNFFAAMFGGPPLLLRPSRLVFHRGLCVRGTDDETIAVCRICPNIPLGLASRLEHQRRPRGQSVEGDVLERRAEGLRRDRQKQRIGNPFVPTKRASGYRRTFAS